MNRTVLAILGVAIGAVLLPGMAAARADEKSDVKRSAVTSLREAEAELFGPATASDFADGYTSHFNFDNRTLGSNPPTTNKLRCAVECKLSNGSTSWFTQPSLRKVLVGELVTLDINQAKVRVVACRFWWKLGLFGRWHDSGWVKADEGYYIVYAFLVWRGYNEFEKPIDFYQEPLDEGVVPATGATSASK